MKNGIKYGLLVLGAIFFLAYQIKGNIPHEDFDPEKWKNWKESETNWSLRWDMMNSLRNNHQLEGKSKEDIIEMLGEPDSKKEGEFTYFLGMAGHGIDVGNLILKFGKNGKVVQVTVRRS